LVRNFGNPNAALSAEAEAAIYTDEPVDPERLVNYHKRLEAERKRQQEVERRRQASGAPMRFAASAGR
jgi:DNA-binding NtrC family response regulator